MTHTEIIALAKQCGLWSEYAGPIDRIEAFFHAAQKLGASQAQQPTEKGTACSTSNFRKKPVVIQAKQLTEETIREVYEWVHGPVTLKHRLAEDRWDDYCGIVKTDGMNIPTLEDGSDGRAKHVASIGDWIIRGIAGEFYPCKPDIFAATYEPVAQAQQSTEPELPEAVAYRQWNGDEGYWYYGDASCAEKNDELLYTAAQMHDHYAAGVRAGKATGKQRLQVPTGWAAPKDQYAVPVLFNPYTGEPRDVRDVQSDPQGILIVPPGKVHQLAAMQGGQQP
jgi:hypothetical protein